MPKSVPNYLLYGDNSAREAEFWLHCETIPERSRLHGWEIRPHRHEAFFQVLYISDGNGEVLAEGRWHAIRQGTAVFVPPGTPHGFRFSRDVGGLVVTVSRDRLDTLCAADASIAAFAAAPRLLPDIHERAAFGVSCLRRVAEEMEEFAVARMTMIEGLLASALVAFVRAAGIDANARHGEFDRDHERMEKLNALVGRHFREHRPVSFFAGHIGLSVGHLNRLLRARTGRGLRALVELRLMEEAKRNLVFTALPAQSIALTLGYSDPAYFNRAFRRHCGVTPAEYRRLERSKLRY